MYKTCIFCHAALGHNEVLAAFPVGRRLAFDAAHGRLWVVCSRCARWNLTPLESRWEAVNACEHLFRDTRVRYSTENIGFARLAEGLDLVRIGTPLRPEFAAWRYGDNLLRRRRKHIISACVTGVGWGIANPILAGLPLVAFPLIGLGLVGASIIVTRVARRHGRLLPIQITTDSGDTLRLERACAGVCRIRAGASDQSWMLQVPNGRQLAGSAQHESLTGHHAIRALALLLPHVNAAGARLRRVKDAVDELEQVPSPRHYFAVAEAKARARGWGYGILQQWPAPLRLAMEMAAHEETERQALEGDLAHLERAWREAESIAAVADRLALPPGVELG